jgi:hypothetical protein
MKLRLVCNRPLFLAVLTVLACILPSATAQEITKTYYDQSAFTGYTMGFPNNNDGATLFGAAFNSTGLQVFSFTGSSALNVYKAEGAASILSPNQMSLAAGFSPSGIATDSDGNFWFVDGGNNAVGFLSTKGITEYPSPICGSYDIVGCIVFAGGITLGSDGAMWVSGQITVSCFVNSGQLICKFNPIVARVASDGTFTFYTSGPGESLSGPSGSSMATGSDGNVYFPGIFAADSNGTLTGQIYKVTPAGQTTTYSLAGQCVGGTPQYQGGMILGPDGNIWFIDNCGANYPTSNIIGNITPDGVITTFPISTLALSLASGSDGAIWFTNASYEIGRITTSGTATYTAIPTNELVDYTACDGAPFFSGLGAIFQGPKGTLEFFGSTLVNGGDFPCTYLGSFKPKAPDEDHQEQASSVKAAVGAPPGAVPCGPGNPPVDKCILTIKPSLDWEGNTFQITSAEIDYTYYQNPPYFYTQFIAYGPTFGQCDVKTLDGQTVYMNPIRAITGTIPVPDPPAYPGQLPAQISTWQFPNLSAAATGAAYGERYSCFFDFVLSETLNTGGPYHIRYQLFVRDGHVGK